VLIPQTLFLVHDFLDLGMDLQNGPWCPPQCWAFSSFGFEHHYISDFCGTLKSFWNSFMPPSFVWALLNIEDFLSCPPSVVWALLLLRTFSCPPRVVRALLVIKDFFFHLPPSVGCDPSQGYVFKKKLLGSKGDYKGFLRICERIIKDGLSSFQMHAFRIGKLWFLTCEYVKWFLIIHAIKTQLWSYLMVFGLSFRFFIGVRISLEFSELVYQNKHQFDFCFCIKTLISQKSLWKHGVMLFFFGDKKKGKHQRILGVVVLWVEGVFSMLFAWRHIMNTGKHMILLTGKAHLTEKVLWHYKLNC